MLFLTGVAIYASLTSKVSLLVQDRCLTNHHREENGEIKVDMAAQSSLGQGSVLLYNKDQSVPTSIL